jgi:rubrerythrin
VLNIESVLTRLVARPALHARFANTLSCLEYMGVRKIFKSQDQACFSAELLSHAGEEIRHAQILKRLALQLSAGSLETCDTYAETSLLEGRLAQKYFQRIDQAVARFFPKESPWIHYLITTLIIEERAQRFYPVYAGILEQARIPNAVPSIVRDEEKHLEQVLESLKLTPLPDLSQTLASLRDLEMTGFHEFLRGVEISLAA